MSRYLPENLEASLKHPRLTVLLEKQTKQSPPAEYQRHIARNQSPTLVVQREKGGCFTYHSKYDPQGEAAKQVGDAPKTYTHFIVLGLGLGYVLDEVLSRLSPPEFPHQITVVEPDPWVFFHAADSRDLKKALLDPRVDWCVQMTPDEIGDFWHSGLDWSVMTNLCILEHPPSLTRFPEYFQRIKEKIRYFSTRSKGNLYTLMHIGSEFLTNNFLNLDAIAGYRGIQRLFGRFSGVPGIVVAAGPSLAKNIHQLSSVKGRFPIIAVDTALRPMIDRGIKPDIVCAGDPSYLNSLDFVGMENEQEVILAFEPMTHPDIPKLYSGPKLLMNFGGGVSPWLEKFREPIGFIGCWGSIATTAFELAKNFGCDPIIFVGLDLSFQDGRLHISGSYSDDVLWDKLHPFTSLEHETVEYVAERGVHRFVRENGEAVFTDQSMFMYRNWFEDQFRQASQKIINATEGGIVEKHVETAPLAECLQRYEAKAVDVKGVLAEALAKPLVIDEAGMMTEIRLLRSQLQTCMQMAGEGLESTRKLLNLVGKSLFREISGMAKAQMEDVMARHDQICDFTRLYAWVSVWNAKFTTRHTMELTALKSDPEAPAKKWVDLLRSFFDTMRQFYSYLSPLIDSGIGSMKGLNQLEQGRSEARKWGGYGLS
jgi:hypothetical protein